MSDRARHLRRDGGPQYLLNQAVYSPASSLRDRLSAPAPDIVQAEVGGGPSTPLQVNLFMHQVTNNAAWRNVGFPSLAAGRHHAADQPAAGAGPALPADRLRIHDCEAEALLGYAILLMHETPVFAAREHPDGADQPA